jgi:hypothetical protein
VVFLITITKEILHFISPMWITRPINGIFEIRTIGLLPTLGEFDK